MDKIFLFIKTRFMKNGFLLIISLLFLSFSFAANTVIEHPPLKAKDILIPIGNTGQKISLLDLSRIKVKEAEALTGKKMSLLEKTSFRIAQRKLRMSINYDGTLNNKKLEKRLKNAAAIGGGFHVLGFLLGFFLSLIGVLIAYLIPGEDRQGRIKWAWIGAAISAVIWLIAIIA